MSYFRWDGEDLILDCHLQPKASADEFAGLHGDRLKIRLRAPPVDGKANALLLAFLGNAFGVAKSRGRIAERRTQPTKTSAHSPPQTTARTTRFDRPVTLTDHKVGI